MDPQQTELSPHARLVCTSLLKNFVSIPFKLRIGCFYSGMELDHITPPGDSSTCHFSTFRSYISLSQAIN